MRSSVVLHIGDQNKLHRDPFHSPTHLDQRKRRIGPGRGSPGLKSIMPRQPHILPQFRISRPLFVFRRIGEHIREKHRRRKRTAIVRLVAFRSTVHGQIRIVRFVGTGHALVVRMHRGHERGRARVPETNTNTNTSRKDQPTTTNPKPNAAKKLTQGADPGQSPCTCPRPPNPT